MRGEMKLRKNEEYLETLWGKKNPHPEAKVQIWSKQTDKNADDLEEWIASKKGGPNRSELWNHLEMGEGNGIPGRWPCSDQYYID